eukprot:gene2141-4173_t
MQAQFLLALVLCNYISICLASNIPIQSSIPILESIYGNNQLNKNSTNGGFSRPAVNLTVITWNLAETSPSEKDCEFIKKFRNEDLIVIGVQECEDIRPRRREGRRSRAWRALQENAVGQNFERIASHKMGGIQIAVFAKKTVAKKVKAFQVLDVAWAVCVLLRLKGKTIAFVNAHLAAHQGKVAERNADYHRITTSIMERAPADWLVKTKADDKAMMARKSKKTKAKTMRSRPMGTSKSKSATRQGLAETKKKTGHRTGSSKQFQQRRQQKPQKGKEQGGWVDQFLVATGLPQTDFGKSRSGTTSSDRKDNKANRTPSELATNVNECPLWKFDSTIFFGDLNYRADVPRLEVELFKALGCVSEDPSPTSRRVPPPPAQTELQQLLQYDQLRRERFAGRVFAGLKEGKISFLPTFKYDKRSDSYDSSAKRRSPAWTDRVLYTADESSGKDIGIISQGSDAGSSDNSVPLLSLRDYSSIDSRHSDHRPVVAKFSINI